MEINKFVFSLLFGLLLVTCFSSSVSAVTGVAITEPASSATISGIGIILNATVGGSVDNFTCEAYMKSTSLTANTTWSIVFPIGTQNGTATTFNGTFSTSIALEDGNDYSFNMSCSNETNEISNTTTSISIDNTVPSTPTLSPSDGNRDTDGSVTFTGTVVGINTTSCVLYFPETNPGSPRYSMTHSGDSCTYSLTSIPEQSYKWYVVANDSINSSRSVENMVHIDVSSGGAKGAGAWLISEGKARPGRAGTLAISSIINGETIPIFFIVGVVIVVVYFVIKTPKRKR